MLGMGNGHTRPRKVIIEAPDGRLICRKYPINVSAHRTFPKYELSLSHNVYTNIGKSAADQILKELNNLFDGIQGDNSQQYVLKKVNRPLSNRFQLDLYYLKFLSRINFTIPHYRQVVLLPFNKLADILPIYTVSDKVTVNNFEFSGVNDLQYLKKFLKKEYDN